MNEKERAQNQILKKETAKEKRVNKAKLYQAHAEYENERVKKIEKKLEKFKLEIEKFDENIHQNEGVIEIEHH